VLEPRRGALGCGFGLKRALPPAVCRVYYVFSLARSEGSPIHSLVGRGAAFLRCVVRCIVLGAGSSFPPVPVLRLACPTLLVCSCLRVCRGGLIPCGLSSLVRPMVVLRSSTGFCRTERRGLLKCAAPSFRVLVGLGRRPGRGQAAFFCFVLCRSTACD